MGRDIDLTDNGVAIFREAVGNGNAAITVDAPADLTGAAGSYAMELLDQLPGSQQFLTINAAGKWQTNAGVSGTLDAAYDSGGPGAGRVIVADNGALEVQGAGGIHINSDGDAARAVLVIQSDAAFDATIEFVEDSNQMFEFGYDQSRGGLVIGLVDFTAPAFFMEDITADVGFNEVDPAARVHITDTAQTNLIVERTGSPICRIALVDSTTGGFGVVGIQSSADDLQLVAGSAVAVHVDGFSGQVHIGGSAAPAANAKLQVSDAGSMVGLFTSATGLSRLSLEASGTTAPGHVGVHASADTLILYAGNTNSLVVSADGFLFATNWNIQADGDASFGNTGDASDHSVTIRAPSTDSSILNFSDGGSSGVLTYFHDLDRFTFAILGNTELSIRVEGLSIGNPGGAFTGDNVIFIQNGLSAPSASVTNGVSLYSEDVAASAELKVRDESGAVTVLSPHAEAYGHKLSEDMAWSFYSERAGKYIWVDMLEVIRAVEHLYGYELVHEGEAA